MSMQEVERGLNIISRALKTGKFTKMQLEYVVVFADAIKNDTNKVLEKIESRDKENTNEGG